MSRSSTVSLVSFPTLPPDEPDRFEKTLAKMATCVDEAAQSRSELVAFPETCNYLHSGPTSLEAEPLEWKYPRTAVRMTKRDLWGMHLRIDAWQGGVREDWNDAGLSSSRFDIPESKKVIVGGGSLGADPHYCIRIIRVDVAE